MANFIVLFLNSSVKGYLAIGCFPSWQEVNREYRVFGSSNRRKYRRDRCFFCNWAMGQLSYGHLVLFATQKQHTNCPFQMTQNWKFVPQKIVTYSNVAAQDELVDKPRVLRTSAVAWSLKNSSQPVRRHRFGCPWWVFLQTKWWFGGDAQDTKWASAKGLAMPLETCDMLSENLWLIGLELPFICNYPATSRQWPLLE